MAASMYGASSSCLRRWRSAVLVELRHDLGEQRPRVARGGSAALLDEDV
jgi:hypothetical protein